ncbi:MAG: acetolactate synthase small subunit [Candidatus Omnitrophota bacterium]|jgi:acetolactate synthase-1/3 small subunit
MKHTISAIVENKPGVLARIAGLFSARGYNIASLAVSETLDPSISYLTMVVSADDEKILEQIKKQLHKLIDIIKITDFTKKEHAERELILAKVHCPPKEKAKLEKVLAKYTARLIKHKEGLAIISAVGEQAEVKEILDDLSQFSIKELVRTGKLAISLD